jgi:hypothetical protein
MSGYYGSARLTTGSEEEDYYFLQPMFEKLPPNEIISQRYAPDVATQVRLMYVPSHTEPRMNARITCTLSHPKLKMQNWKIMPNVSMCSIIWVTHMQRSSIKLSTLSSIMPSITLCPKLRSRPECSPLSMCPSTIFTANRRYSSLRTWG